MLLRDVTEVHTCPHYSRIDTHGRWVVGRMLGRDCCVSRMLSTPTKTNGDGDRLDLEPKYEAVWPASPSTVFSQADTEDMDADADLDGRNYDVKYDAVDKHRRGVDIARQSPATYNMEVKQPYKAVVGRYHPQHELTEPAAAAVDIPRAQKPPLPKKNRDGNRLVLEPRDGLTRPAAKAVPLMSKESGREVMQPPDSTYLDYDVKDDVVRAHVAEAVVLGREIITRTDRMCGVRWHWHVSAFILHVPHISAV